MSDKIPEWVKSAKVGDRVVYLGQRMDEGWVKLEPNHIYTIREIFGGVHPGEEDKVGLRLVGIVNTTSGGIEKGYNCRGFKPLQSGLNTLENLLTAPIPEELKNEVLVYEVT